MVAKKTNKKEARKAVIANQFGVDTVFTRQALYNRVKNNSLFKGTKDNKQLVTNALVALVGEGLLERTGSKKNSMYKLSAQVKQKKRTHRLKQAEKPRLKKSVWPERKHQKPYDEYLTPQEAAKAAPQKGLLTGLTSLSVQMIMLQKKIEDTVLSQLGFNESKEAAKLISEYVLVATQIAKSQ
jgi:DNA-binding transcriptional regulator PaaX